jgi:hypothetical protein
MTPRAFCAWGWIFQQGVEIDGTKSEQAGKAGRAFGSS